jgi:hypothetical protein
LTDYAKIAARSGGFSFYAENVLFPAIKKNNPSLTFDEMVWQSSLRSIEDYLKSAKQIGLVTNADDFILAEDDVEYLRQVFANRAKIYPKGGHCGNMAYTDNVAYMVDFFRRETERN